MIVERGAIAEESEGRQTDPIIDLIPAMVWSATSDGMLDFANQHFLDFIGAPLEEISGVKFYGIFHPDDTSHLASEWHSIMASKTAKEVVGRLRRADGQYRWCTLRQSPGSTPKEMSRDGTVSCWISKTASRPKMH